MGHETRSLANILHYSGDLLHLSIEHETKEPLYFLPLHKEITVIHAAVVL